jgi:hypothetical protein
LRDFWNEHGAWSEETFGPSRERGPIGALKHLAKEAGEAQEKPWDIEEYADCLFLVFDSARRAGFSYDDLSRAAFAKLEKNKLRVWGDWRLAPPDSPIEHKRGIHD